MSFKITHSINLIGTHRRVEKRRYLQQLLDCVAVSHVQLLCVELDVRFTGLK